MHETRWLSDAELRVWHNFIEASQLLERRLDSELRQHFRLSHVQYEILTRLTGAPGHRLRMTELAAQVVTAKSSLTYQIGNLARRGLVTREGAGSDARGVFAALTDAGVALLDEVGPAHLANVRRYLLESMTPQQAQALADAMATCRERLLADPVA